MLSYSSLRTKISSMAAIFVVFVGLAVPLGAGAASQPRDYDSYSIMYGGAWSKAEWQSKVDKGDTKHSSANLRQIYFNEGRGITAANFKNTVNGTVLNDGRVLVDGVVVATDAHVQGRNYLPGSVKDGSVYSRPIPDPFRPASDTAAWVNMDGGVYHYAIIKACGNTVRGKAVPKPTPTPTPKPTATPTPTPTPTPVITPTPSPTPTPVESFACLKLTVSQPDEKNAPRTFRFTVDSKVENVALTGYRFGVSEEGASNAVDVQDIDETQNFTDYTLGGGNWTVTAQVKTSAGVTAISAPCTAHVTVVETTPTPTITPTPTPGQVLGTTNLPSTGPEALLGGAIGLTAIGYTARGYFRSRNSVLDALRGKDQSSNK